MTSYSFTIYRWESDSNTWVSIGGGWNVSQEQIEIERCKQLGAENNRLRIKREFEDVIDY